MWLAALVLAGCYADAVPLFSDYDAPTLDPDLEVRALASVASRGAVTTGSTCRDLLDPQLELPAVDFVDGGVQDVLTAWVRAVDGSRGRVGLEPLEYGDLWLSTFEPGTRPGHPNGRLTRSPSPLHRAVRLPSAYGVGDFLSVALHEAGHDLDRDADEIPAVGLAFAGALAGCGVSEPLVPLVLDDAVDRALSVYYIDSVDDLDTEEGRYVVARLVVLHLVAELGPTQAIAHIHAASADELADGVEPYLDGESLDAHLERALAAVALSEALGAELEACLDADRAAEVRSWLGVRVAERRAVREVADGGDRAVVEAHLSDPRFADAFLRYRAEVAWETLEHQSGESILGEGSATPDKAWQVLGYLTPPCDPGDPDSHVGDSGLLDPWRCPRAEPSLDAVYAYRVLAEGGVPEALDLLRAWAFPGWEPVSPWPEHVHNQYVVTVRDLAATGTDGMEHHIELARAVPCADVGLTGFWESACEEAHADLR